MTNAAEEELIFEQVTNLSIRHGIEVQNLELKIKKMKAFMRDILVPCKCEKCNKVWEDLLERQGI